MGNFGLEGVKNVQEALMQSAGLCFAVFKEVFFWNLAVFLCAL